METTQNTQTVERDMITKEIIESFGKISENKNGWERQLNLVSWNNRAAKFDIREWSEDKSYSGKGSTFTAHEMKMLKDILNSIDFEAYEQKAKAQKEEETEPLFPGEEVVSN